MENESDSLRKELTDVRRQLTNCIAERDKYNSSCRELRDHVKRVEGERRDAARARDEAYHKIAGKIYTMVKAFNFVLSKANRGIYTAYTTADIEFRRHKNLCCVI